MAEYDFDHPKWVKKNNKSFRIFDHDKDGKVDYYEFTKMLRDVKEACKPSKEELKIAYEIIDDIAKELGIEEGNPGVGIEEWVASRSKFGVEEIAREKRGEPMKFKSFQKALFGIMDTNKDDHLSLEELTVVCKIHAEATDAQCKNAFDILDKNQNGEISCEEFVDTYFEMFFSINDINLFGDGYMES